MADCSTCKVNQEKIASVPAQTHQMDMARLERSNHRQTVCNLVLAFICVILGILLYLSHINSEKALLENNQKWIDMWGEYDFESYEYQQDGEGVNIIGNGNGVDYNVTESSGPQTD